MYWKQVKSRKQIRALGGSEIERNLKQCGGKNCYNKKQADRVAHAVMRRRNKRIHAYECNVCHYYHLTSIEHYGRPIRSDKPGRQNRFIYES